MYAEQIIDIQKLFWQVFHRKMEKEIAEIDNDDRTNA
jgi:hypothetical protein